MVTIAHIHTPFPEKFGIPRQSGLVSEAKGTIIMEPQFRNPDAFKGLEEFSHLWLLWEFSQAKQETFHATVAPPRLGGRQRRGVFATRSPFRPNSIGLSCVKLENMALDPEHGPVITVSGVDLLDNTPIYDIKPYLPYADAHPEAVGGFADAHVTDGIEVVFPQELLMRLPKKLQAAAVRVLGQDPRAAYNKKADYVYGMAFADYDIRFVVKDHCLIVKDVQRRSTDDWSKIK